MARSSYGSEHQRRRRALEPAAYGTACALCGGPMLRGQSLDLDHPVPLAEDPAGRGERMVHSTCNRSSGGALGNRRRRLSPSRAW